jgi:hypothetical protein
MRACLQLSDSLPLSNKYYIVTLALLRSVSKEVMFIVIDKYSTDHHVHKRQNRLAGRVAQAAMRPASP